MARSAFILAASFLALGCSSGDGTTPEDGGGETSAPSDAAADARPSGDAAHDAPVEAGDDAHVPATPTCKTGDRAEFAGVIPSTFIAVAVCSACGESYVVAANGTASAADVTVGNGTKTITTTVPANATATSALLADDASNGTVTVCSATGTKQCLPASENKRYCNPFRAITSLVPERIDQGVDYAGAGPIYAMAPGTVDVYHNRDDSGWPGGTFISYKVTAGPANGKTIYLAENIDLNTSLKPGSYVFSGTVLGTLVNAYPNSESGWGVPGAGYTAEYSCYTEGCMTAMGVNFNELLVALKAPSGTTGTSGCCTSTMGYPSSWSSLISAWQ